LPVAEKSLIFVEQASCLLLKKINLCGTGILPVAEKSLIFVEQASCLLLKKV